MLPQTFTKDTRIRVGVLLAPPPVQVLDLAPIDLFHMLSKEYLGVMDLLPKPIKTLAINDIEIMYIADYEDPDVKTFHNTTPSPNTTETSDNTQPASTTSPSHDKTVYLAPLTANMTIQLTTSITDPSVQPGHLTILLIPGPDPSAAPSQRTKTFISSHATCGTSDIITICTGIFPACYSGICDDKTVTAPRGFGSQLTKKFPKVKKFEDLRWTKDVLTSSTTSTSMSATISKQSEIENNKELRPAELWTSAGITNGHDCIAAYIRTHFDRELGDVVVRMADIGERSQKYDIGSVADGVWWITTILRALIKGIRR